MNTTVRRVVLGVVCLGLAVPALSEGPTAYGPATRSGATPALRDLVPAEGPIVTKRTDADLQVGEKNIEPIRRGEFPGDGLGDLARVGGGLAPSTPPGATTVEFDGNSSQNNFDNFGFRVSPPDTNGDVGPNHYVQTTNLLVRIFDKAGAPLTPPFRMSALFAAIGGICSTNDNGDPIVLYDPLADRWMIAQFAFASVNAPPYSMCVAVSQTPDPTGAWFAYQFPTPNVAGGQNFPDYPHLGVWPDGYYMTVNQFLNGGSFNGTGAYVYEREKMLVGDPTALQIYFDLNTTAYPEFIGGMLPSDLDGLTAPPTGRPNTFVYFTATEFGDPADGLRLFDFAADFAVPASSTFTERAESTYAAPLAVAAFDPLTPAGRDDIPQPPPAGATAQLDAIADRLMHRLQYRNRGGFESLVVDHTVNADSPSPFRAGVRYYELRSAAPGGAFSVFEQASFAPADGVHRWMGSAAVDHQGNLAFGYSVSSSAVFPGLRYAGKLAGEAPGALAEVLLEAGTGVQTSTGSRWGDYSAIGVDPVDDCTFWFTSEYYTVASQATSTVGWLTRVGAFRFAACTAPPAGALEVNVTNCTTAAPIAGAKVTATGGFLRQTDGAGLADFDPMAAGNYTVTATAPSYSSASASATVNNGATTTINLCIEGAPAIDPAGASLVDESCTPADGALEPGELATVSFCVENNGVVDTVSLVGTLQATGGVTSPTGSQNYGVVVAGGAPVCRSFSFVVDPAALCGSTLTATIDLQDGVDNLGTAVYTFDLGALSTVLGENFDGVMAPTLPAGWTAANAAGGDGIFWVTSSAGNPAPAADTPPNAAFVNDPNSVHDKRLDSPSIPIGTATARLTFRNNFNLENTFDGGVLEISIGGGAFTDIVAAGGSFVSGGYTGTISASFMSPIAGRQAWTGNSSGFITTAVDLPAAAAGQNVVLRFRMGSDNSVAAVGWRVDSLVIQERTCNVTCPVICSLSQPPNLPVATDSGLCSATVAYPPPGSSGACGAITCSPPSGSVFPLGTTAVLCTAAAGPSVSFDVIVSDLEPPALACPADLFFPLPPGALSSVIDYSTPVPTDNCPGVIGSCVPPSGDVFPLGTSTVVCSALDAAGNPAQCDFDVTLAAQTIQEIPTASSLGLAALALLLGAAALLVLRRQG